MTMSALFPLDGSESSLSAQTYAIDLAKRYGLVLNGLGIVDVPTIEAGAAAPIGGGAFKQSRDHALIEEAKEKVAGFLAAFAEACEKSGVGHSEKSVEGLPYEVINEQSRRDDLIIIGRNTCFHFETSDEPGDTLAELLKDAARPMLIVPEDRRAGSATLIATDEHPASAHTIQILPLLGLFCDQPLHLMGVESDEESAERLCRLSADHLLSRGLDVAVHAIGSPKDPEDLIIEQIEAVDASVLVMGAHGGGRLRDLFFGSALRNVLKQASVPVFVHH